MALAAVQMGRQPEIGLFVDADNLNIRLQEALGPHSRLDYRAFLNYAFALGRVVEATVYTSRPAASTRPTAFEFYLKRAGFRVVSCRRILLPDGKEKSTADVALAMDVGMALARGCISYVLIGSGDASFLPLCERTVSLASEIEFVGPDRGSSSHLMIAASRFTPVSRVPGLIVRREV